VAHAPSSYPTTRRRERDGHLLLATCALSDVELNGPISETVSVCCTPRSSGRIEVRQTRHESPLARTRFTRIRSFLVQLSDLDHVDGR
jgi:hypothetical protein